MKDWDNRVQRALSHPIRRSIIECLLEKEYLSFSELLKSVGVGNHGRLGFHLRALKEFVEPDPSKQKYRLTEMGQLAGELIWDTRFLIAKGPEGLAHEPQRYARRLRLGDHAVLFYETDSFKRGVALPFLLAGVLKSEAAVYLVPENEPNSETREVLWYEINTDLFRRKSFTIMSAENWYFGKRKAKAETIIANWQTLAKEKQKAGFAGLRVAGETKVFFDSGKTEALLRYEEALGRQLPTNLCELCLYDISRLEGEEQVN